ncbi:hypothetical protein PoB_006888800 [Plakobranchus ocellatus]|uniref:Uncharacterized protein n=1 Tax=Plakobranchus ocellatus TaxID=259542 RepID=A0AAV4DEA1_9GAST|nr:hypothetical protein PoB_006888800 [Plakobranchus ocellatus]
MTVGKHQRTVLANPSPDVHQKKKPPFTTVLVAIAPIATVAAVAAFATLLACLCLSAVAYITSPPDTQAFTL